MQKKKSGYTLTKGVMIGAVLGLVFGLVLGDKASNVSFLGTLFLRLINMPLILLIM